MSRTFRCLAKSLSALLTVALILGAAAPPAMALEGAVHAGADLSWAQAAGNGLLSSLNLQSMEEEQIETQTIRIAEFGEASEGEASPEASVVDAVYGDPLSAQAGHSPLERISWVPDADETLLGDSRYPAVSEDGRIVAFQSEHAGLVPNDRNESSDIFVYDRATRELSRISVNQDGTEGDGHSWAPLVSADGQWVVFSSEARNLTDAPPEAEHNLYLHNRETGTTERIAESVAAADSSGQRTFDISADGRYVAFFSMDDNGVDEDHNRNGDVFWKDLLTGSIQRITDNPYYDPQVSFTAMTSTSGYETSVSISADGRYVAYDSWESVVEGDVNRSSDVFVYDAWTGTTERASVSTDGREGNADSENPMISASGDYVVFESDASNLVEGVGLGRVELYVRDLRAGTTSLVGDVDDASYKSSPIISADGRYVTYGRFAGDIRQVHVTDRHTGATTIVSRNADEDGNGHSNHFYMTDNGKYAAFASEADNLTIKTGGIEEPYWDVYVGGLESAEGETYHWPAEASVQADQIGGTYVALSWTPAEGAPNGAIYRVAYSSAHSGTERLAGITKQTQMLIAGLETGQTYDFRVSIGNDQYQFQSEPLMLTAVTTLPAVEANPPGQPSIDGLYVEDGMLKVNWTNPPDADLVATEVYWRRSGSAGYRHAGVYPLMTNQAAIPGIALNRTYEVMLKALDADGNAAIAERSVDTPEGITIDRILSSDGKQGKYPERLEYVWEHSVDVSGDGRYIVFSSEAANLTPDANGEVSHVYLYDVVTDRLQLFSKDIETGLPLSNHSLSPTISSDGRFVVFIAETDRAGEPEQIMYYYDRDSDGNGVLDEENGTSTDRIHPEAGGFAFTYVLDPDVSDDGSVVAFRVAEDGDYGGAVYIVDMTSGEHTLVYGGEDVSIQDLDLSGDGKYLAIVEQEDVLEQDADGTPSVYLYEVEWGEYALISPPELSSEYYRLRIDVVAVSDNGRFVAYDYFGEGDSWYHQVYVYDTASELSHPVSDSELGWDVSLDMSGEGRYVAYTKTVDIYEEYMWRDRVTLYRYDTLTEETTRIDVSMTGEYGNDSSDVPAISGDGSTIAFLSAADNLMTGDTNHYPDVYYAVLEHRHDGTAPYWPAGSMLQIEDATDRAVTLRWDAAMDDTGIWAYEIRYGDAQSVQVDGRSLSATVEGLRPGTEYVFSVIAIDASGNRSETGLLATATTEAGSESAEIGIERVRGYVPQTYPGYTTIGKEMRITVIGDPGLSGQALVQYLNAEQEARESAIPLTEVSAGEYAGTFLIEEGIASISGLIGMLRDGERSGELDAELRPVEVGSNLSFSLQTEEGVSLEGGYLSVFSTEAARSYVTGVALAGPGTYALHGLPEGAYDFTIHSRAGSLLYRGILPEPVVNGTSRVLEIDVPVPSVFRGSVWHEDYYNRSTVLVTVTDADGRTLFHGDVQANQEEAFAVEGLKAGEALTVHIAAPSPGYESAMETIVIQPGNNEGQFVMQPKPKGTLSGRVLTADGTPLPRAYVRAVILTPGGVYEAVTISAQDGSYELELVEGEGKVYAELPDGQTETAAISIAANRAEELDLVYETLTQGYLQIRIYTKFAGSEWFGPLDLDWSTKAQYRMQLSHHVYASASSDTLLIRSKPGESVKVCVDGADSGLPLQCGTTVMDAHNRGAIELRMEQRGATVTARLAGWESYSFQVFETTLYKIGSEGERTFVGSYNTFSDMRIELQEPGSYFLEVEAAYDVLGLSTISAFRTFEVDEGDTIHLGDILLQREGVYKNMEGNETVILPYESVPGGTVMVRTTLHNTYHLTEQTKLVLDIPAGTALKPNSITWNGEAAEAAEVSNHEFILDLGSVDEGERHVVTYHLELSSDYDRSDLGVIQRVRFMVIGREDEEWLGSAYAKVTPVKLEAPAVTGFRDIVVSGLAPAGSIVSIYDGDALLGQTFAAPNGLWTKKIVLPGESRVSQHRLWAQSERGDDRWITDVASVTYEHDYPELISATMRQPGKLPVSFDPREGIARFPYVVGPGGRFMVSIVFQNADRVRNPKLLLGGNVLYMSKKGDEFLAYVESSDLGSISISYDVAKGLDIPDAPNEEQYETELPQAFRDMTWQVVDSNADEAAGRAYARMSGVTAIDGQDTSVDFEVSMSKVDYEPTQADLNWTLETGNPMHGFRFNYSTKDNELHVTLEGYIPESEFEALQTGEAIGLLAGGATAAANLGKSAPVRPVRIAAVSSYVKVGYKMIVKHGGEPWDAYEFYDDVSDTFENMGKLEQLNALMDLATNKCGPDMAASVTRRAQSIANTFMAHEAVKWTMIAAGAALGPATFGIGTVLLFIASEAAEGKLDGIIERRIENLKNSILNSDDCKEKKPEKEEEEKTEPKARKLADPVWIYDPSGYVYEVEESNRIEGVTATAFQLDEASGQWVPWDAEWYGQQNPLITDKEGKYGWDVPEGKWKVVYQKDGYVTAESEELTVLPPHTDVNVGMASTLPPSVTHVAAAPGGSRIEVYFDRHVKADAVNEWVFTVSEEGEDGEVLVEGTVTVDESDRVSFVAADDTETIVTRSAVFTPSADLEIGRSYTVKVSQGIPSYNGVPMTNDHIETVFITEHDTTPPGSPRNITTFLAADTAVLQWDDPTDPDFSHIEIAWRRQGESAFGEPVTIGKGEEYAVIAPLEDGVAYDFMIRAVDAQGNANETSVTEQTALAHVEADVVPPLEVQDAEAAVAGNRIEVSWTEQEGSDHQAVIVAWQEAGLTNPVQSEIVDRGIGRFTIQNLRYGTDYELTVSTVDGADNRSTGALLDARTDDEPAAPSQPGSPSGPIGVPSEPSASDRHTFETDGQGGAFEAFDGALTLIVPEGAFLAPEQLTIARRQAPLLPQDGPGAWSILSDAYDISGGEADPLLPLTLELAFDSSKLDGEDARKLGIYKQSEEHANGWIYIGGIVDPADGRVTAEIPSYGTYAVLLYQRSFQDLIGHWSQADVEVLASRQLIHGVSEQRFEPNRTVTRAEMAKLLVDAAKRLGRDAANASDERFADVQPEDWFYVYVNEAAQMGLVSGYGGEFRPNDPVTREEMAVMLVRLLGAEPTGPAVTEQALARFGDADRISGWAKPFMAVAVELGLLQGMGQSTLSPGDTATRAQSASVLLRLLSMQGVVHQP